MDTLAVIKKKIEVVNTRDRATAMKASIIRLTKNGIAIQTEPGKPLAIDAAAAVMMTQRLNKRRKGHKFIPNPTAREK